MGSQQPGEWVKGRGNEKGGKLKAGEVDPDQDKADGGLGWSRWGGGQQKGAAPHSPGSHKPAPGLGLCEEDTASLPCLSSPCVSVFSHLLCPVLSQGYAAKATYRE